MSNTYRIKLFEPNELQKEIILVAALVAICALGIGLMISSLGIFLEPIQKDLAWTSEQASRLPSAFFLAGAPTSLLVGAALDRIGGRLTMTLSSAFAAAGFLVAATQSNQPAMMAGFAIAGVGSVGSTVIPAAYVAARYVRFRLGLTLAIILCGSALGSAILPALIQEVISSHGWRIGLIAIATATGLITTPLAFFLIPKRSRGVQAPDEENEFASNEDSIRLRIPFRKMTLVTLTQLCFTGSVMALFVHFVPLLTDRGFNLASALTIYGVMNILSPVGLLSIGWLADRFGVFLVFPITIGLNTLSILTLFFVPPSNSIGIALAVFVLIWGTTSASSAQLTPIIISRVVPVETTGLCLGISGFFDSVASAAGPALAGALTDHPGGYQNVILAATCAAAIALAPMGFLALGVWRRNR